MKVAIISLALVAVAFAASPVEDAVAEILRSSFDTDPEGSYRYSYETGNGINRQEEGTIKEVVDEENKPHKVVVVRGSYAYIDKDGHQETITYTADESGFHADGPSIPREPVARR